MSAWLDDRVASHAPMPAASSLEPSSDVWLDDRLHLHAEKPPAEDPHGEAWLDDRDRSNSLSSIPKAANVRYWEMLDGKSYLAQQGIEAAVTAAIAQVIRERPANGQARIAALLLQNEAPQAPGTQH